MDHDFSFGEFSNPEAVQLLREMHGHQLHEKLTELYDAIALLGVRTHETGENLRILDTYTALLVDVADDHADELRQFGALASYHDLRGHALNKTGRHRDALEHFKRAVDLDPRNLHVRESLIGQYLKLRDMVRAVVEINRITPRLLESENDSGAKSIVNWAIGYPEVALGLRAGLAKHCLVLMALYRHREEEATSLS